MWKTQRLTDKTQIQAWLETDRLYTAYAIGDLEPELFAQCTWVGGEKGGRLLSIALHFRGLDLSALLLMGDTNGLRAILTAALCPERVYLTCREKHLAMTRDFYAWEKVIPMWRMVLRPERFQPGKSDCIRLTREHANQVTKLYTHEAGVGFNPAQLQRGVFYGLLLEGQLVAVAGTHLVSSTYDVAAVGNVFTHPHHRGRGYGTATTSAVVAALSRRGIRDIVLNVSQSNAPAVHIYEKLGFERVYSFLEGPARARKPSGQFITN